MQKKYVFINQTINFGKIGLHDVKNLTESVLETLLQGFRALSRQILETFKNCLAIKNRYPFWHPLRLFSYFSFESQIHLNLREIHSGIDLYF